MTFSWGVIFHWAIISDVSAYCKGNRFSLQQNSTEKSYIEKLTEERENSWKLSVLAVKNPWSIARMIRGLFCHPPKQFSTEIDKGEAQAVGFEY